MYPDQPAQPAAAPHGPLQLTLGDALVGGGGLLIFLFSFAPFVSYPDAFVKTVDDSRFPGWWNAWANQTFMAPLTWWVIFSGILLLLLALSRRMWAPERERLGFRPSQLQVGLSLFAFFVLVGYAFSAKTFSFGIAGIQDIVSALGNTNPSFSWGGVIMLLGAVVALIGAFLNHLGMGRMIYPRQHAVAAWPEHDPATPWPGGEASPAQLYGQGTFHPAEPTTPAAGETHEWPGGTVEPPSWAGPRSDQSTDAGDPAPDPEDGSSPQR